jgi:hypothetical protein
MDIKKIIQEEVSNFDWADKVEPAMEFPLTTEDLPNLVGSEFTFFDVGIGGFSNRTWEIISVGGPGGVKYLREDADPDDPGYTSTKNFLVRINTKLKGKISWPLINPNTNEIYDWYKS